MAFEKSDSEQADLNQVPSRAESPNRRTLCARFGWLLICVALWPFHLMGQTNAAALTYPANRYLLAVETSLSMQRRADALAHAVQDLLGSAMPIQARRGDTLGVWTFNEEVYTGLLPLQRFSPETQKIVTDRVVGFLRSQKFDRRARFDKLLPVLNRIVTNSAFITVVLVCMGEDEIHGTPFDQRINDFFRTWHQQQKDAAAPFVIALRAQQGKFVDCSMNPSLWPTELPALPKELFIPVPPAHSLAAEPRKRAVPPLIVHGKKPDAAPISPQTSATNTLTVSNTNLASPSTPESASVTSSSPKISPLTVAKIESPVDTGPTPASASVGAANLAPSEQSHSSSKDSGNSPATEQHTISKTDVLTNAAVAGRLDTDRPATPNRSAPTVTRVEVATTAPPARVHYPTILYGIGLVALGMSVAGILIWKRRSRPIRETSIITESIDRRNS